MRVTFPSSTCGSIAPTETRKPAALKSPVNDNLHSLIETAVELGTARTLEVLGVSAGEVSQRKARDTYGKWFMDADRAGRIQPCRVDDGRKGTRHYRVVDILALKVADHARAELQLSTNK